MACSRWLERIDLDAVELGDDEVLYVAGREPAPERGEDGGGLVEGRDNLHRWSTTTCRFRISALRPGITCCYRYHPSHPPLYSASPPLSMALYLAMVSIPCPGQLVIRTLTFEKHKFVCFPRDSGCLYSGLRTRCHWHETPTNVFVMYHCPVVSISYPLSSLC